MATAITGFMETPLNIAAYHCNHKDIRSLLEDPDVKRKINDKDSEGRICLHYTLMKSADDCRSPAEKSMLKQGRKMTVQLLMKNGADSNIANKDGKRAPDVAKEQGFRLLALLMAPTESTQDLLDNRMVELQKSNDRIRQYRQRRMNRKKLKL